MNRRTRRGLGHHRRQCGECTACCSVMSVPDLEKIAGEPCTRLGSSGGCACYQERPRVCSDYRCLWLLGQGEEGWRPDRVGILCNTNQTAWRGYAPGRVLFAFELWSGAFDTPEVVRLLLRATVERVVMTSADGKTREIG